MIGHTIIGLHELLNDDITKIQDTRPGHATMIQGLITLPRYKTWSRYQDTIRPGHVT